MSLKRHLSLVACLAIGLIACSDDASSDHGDATDVAAVDATMQAVRNALAAGDVDAFLERWTDNGLQQLFAETSASFETGYYIGAKQYSLGGSSDTTVAGDTATTVAPLFFRLVGVVRRFSLIRQDGVWKIDGGTLATADAGDATVIDVDFGDSAILFDASAIVDGDIALRVHNTTTKRHELNILTALPDRDITAFFEHPEDEPPLPEGRSMPEGTDFIGGVSAIDPGVTVTVLFSETLPAARYVFFCNAEDNSGQPHSKSGEFAEFTIT